jgi:hypothetical protein
MVNCAELSTRRAHRFRVRGGGVDTFVQCPLRQVDNTCFHASSSVVVARQVGLVLTSSRRHHEITELRLRCRSFDGPDDIAVQAIYASSGDMPLVAVHRSWASIAIAPAPPAPPAHARSLGGTATRPARRRWSAPAHASHAPCLTRPRPDVTGRLLTADRSRLGEMAS